MSKPQRYVLSEVKKQYVEAVGGDQVEVELPNGETVSFPHPLFADAEWKKAVDEAEDDHAKAQAMLGEEQYERFVAAGGRAEDLGLVLMQVNRDMVDQLTDGTPTRSSRSSASTRKR